MGTWAAFTEGSMPLHGRPTARSWSRLGQTPRSSCEAFNQAAAADVEPLIDPVRRVKALPRAVTPEDDVEAAAVQHGLGVGDTLLIDLVFAAGGRPAVLRP